jgi:hypothetical protein
MPVPISPDLIDRTLAWQQQADMAQYQNADVSGPEEQKMTFALLCASPQTPEAFIEANLTNSEMPPRYGYDREQPGIMDVLSISSPRARGRADQVQGGMH